MQLILSAGKKANIIDVKPKKLTYWQFQKGAVKQRHKGIGILSIP